MASGGIKTPVIELVNMYLFIYRNPGLTPTKIARRRGMTRSKVLSLVVAMEKARLFVSEDSRARLWPHSCGGFYEC